MKITQKPAVDSVWSVEVISVRKLEGVGNLRAFVDIRVAGALVITQCAVLDGKRGLYVTLPRQLARDGRWRDVVIAADDDLRGHLEREILKAYEDAPPAVDHSIGAHRVPQGPGLPA